jgi:hypothetical protein
MSQSQDNWKPCVCPVDFDRVNRVGLARSHELIAELLPGGLTSGAQYVVPSRDERRLISIFVDSGKWSDFDVVAHGDGLVGLAAHVFHVSHRDAARLIAHLLGIEWQAVPDVGDTTDGTP